MAKSLAYHLEIASSNNNDATDICAWMNYMIAFTLSGW